MAWDDFAKAVDAWKTAADDTEPDLKDECDQEARRVHLSRGLDHRGILDGLLTPEARVLVTGELRRISKQLLAHDRATAKETLGTTKVTGADLDRTASQRMHDALLIMAQRSNGADPGAKMADPIAHIRTTLPAVAAALERSVGADPSPMPAGEFECESDDGTPLTSQQLLRYLIHSKLHSVVLSQDGAVLHYGKGERWFTRLQKQAAAYRDRFCECGCGLLARHVDADHDPFVGRRWRHRPHESGIPVPHHPQPQDRLGEPPSAAGTAQDTARPSRRARTCGARRASTTTSRVWPTTLRNEERGSLWFTWSWRRLFGCRAGSSAAVWVGGWR